MINYIWGIFIVLGVIISIIKKDSNLTNNLITSGTKGIDMIINLVPLMCLWLGTMKIADSSGLLNIISNKLSKVIRVVFPEIPKGDPAIAYISSNIVMNMLGLGNAATPFGIKAMTRLKELNNNSDIASRSMITFLVINTSSVTIIPTTVISLRIASGSNNPTEIMTACIITTFLFGEDFMFNYLIPIIVIIILIYGLYKKVDIFDTFLLGVKEGLKSSINLFPTIFAMIIAINLLTNSGFILDLSNILKPIFNKISFPVEVLSLAILRPISGSASLSMLSEILSNYGPDSFIGRVASVMQGSTDTTIYIISLYFASIGVKKIKYSLIVGLLSDLISIILSVVIVTLIFGN